MAVAATAAVHAESLASLVRSYHDHPTPQTRAAILRYANAHSKDTDGALAMLALGSSELEDKQAATAAGHLKASEKRLPKLADYPAYLRAAAAFELRDFASVDDLLKPVWQNSPPSPLVSKAVVLQANAYIQGGQPKKALSILDEHGAEAAPEKVSLLRARAYEALGDTNDAAARFQQVYTEYPLSPGAADASAALTRYQQPSPQARLVRCWKLLDAREYTKAKREIEALIPQLNGSDLDTARVRLGAASYFLKDYAAALHYLRSLEVATSEADAERLYYMVQCARRLDRGDDLKRAIDDLARSHTNSPWRLQALVGAGNYYLVKNQASDYEPLYRACYESFASDSQASYCNWKAAWGEYLRDRNKGATLFRDHLKRYPASDNASAALYFLGRVAEWNKDMGAARVYYEKAVADYPNQYYGVLSRERLKDAAVAAAPQSSQATEFLAGVAFPKRTHEDLRATPATKLRIDRAHLLTSAGLDDLAESELRYGARHDAQPHVLAVELAQLARQRNEPDRAIRLIKRYAPGYLSLPVDSTTTTLWRLAFPLPFWRPLETYSQQHGLDPFLVAALIRQESEFNPSVVSFANAYGLTQVLPSTGREVSRRLKIRRFNSKMLFRPEVNLQIGTYYLKSILDSLHGEWEATLASYNAGKSRVVNWLNGNNYREPAEFVESIPFAETRQYVQSILRNADVYRRLYANASAVELASTENVNSGRKNAGSTSRGGKSSRTVPQRSHSKLHRVRNT